jgi:hypothetical protein
MKPMIGIASCLIACPTIAFPQTTYVTPTPGGGFIMNTPGAGMPTYVTPTPNGGYIANTPGSGRMPTYANPTPNGGMIVNTPGQAPPYSGAFHPRY